MFSRLLEQLRQEELEKAQWKIAQGMLGPDRDLDVETVRVVSRDEAGAVIVTCMSDAGFAAEAFSDGTVEYAEVPPEQGEGLNYAAFRCAMQYPINPYEQMALPEEAARLLYRHWVDTSAACVAKQGVDVADPPSEETWGDSWAAAPESAWSPFASVDANPDASFRDTIYRSCPREPEGLYPDIP